MVCRRPLRPRWSPNLIQHPGSRARPTIERFRCLSTRTTTVYNSTFGSRSSCIPPLSSSPALQFHLPCSRSFVGLAHACKTKFSSTGIESILASKAYSKVSHHPLYSCALSFGGPFVATSFLVERVKTLSVCTSTPLRSTCTIWPECAENHIE